MDKVPAVDTVNDAVQTFIRPSMGGLLAAATAARPRARPVVWMTSNPWVGVILGRDHPASCTAARRGQARDQRRHAGLRGPVRSTVEDGASVGLSLVAVFMPVLVIVALLGVLAALGWLVWRGPWLRRRRVAGSHQ